MNRRDFLNSSLAAAAISTLPTTLFAESGLHPIGMQLYTVRDLMKSDLPGTIAKVAAIGYTELEFAGYFGRSPKEIRGILDSNHVTSPSCHVPYDVVQNHWPEQLEAAHVIGHKFVVCPWIDDAQRNSPDGYKRAAELFNKAGEASRKAGVQFAYHNHYWEFLPAQSLNGQLPYDYFLENIPAENLKMELDLCWISVAAKDPVAYFNKYPGRFPMVHLKDLSKILPLESGKISQSMIDVEAANMVPVGSGAIDWKRLIPAARKTGGAKHFFVENDQPKEPISDLTASYKYLSTVQL